MIKETIYQLYDYRARSEPKTKLKPIGEYIDLSGAKIQQLRHPQSIIFQIEYELFMGYKVEKSEKIIKTWQ